MTTTLRALSSAMNSQIDLGTDYETRSSLSVYHIVCSYRCDFAVTVSLSLWLLNTLLHPSPLTRRNFEAALMRCNPMRGTPTRYMPVREARRERHSHKRYAPARDACPRDACPPDACLRDGSSVSPSRCFSLDTVDVM